METEKRYSATSFAFYAVDENNQLTSVLTTLPQSNDEDLKKTIEQRLSRGSVFTGSGQIVTVDLGIEPANCYFCLLAANEGIETNQYVVCFITECDRGLDSFRNQLDQHALKIESIIKDTLKEEIKSAVKPLLDSWYRDCLLFIVECVKILGKDIKYVIYNAVGNGQISVDTDDKQFENDIEKFHSSCTLSALLSTTSESSESSDTSGSLIDLNPEPHTKTKRIVDILCVTYKSKQVSFSHQSCTDFCERWAQGLLEKFAYSLAEESEINPINLKTISETFKLKTIQDMNTLKRIVKEAELDFYALYRSQIFVRNSGNSQILLMHAMNEEQNTEAMTILKLLEQKSTSAPVA